MAVFHKDEDYGAFLKLINEASDRISMRLLAFCLMPNHFHLILWPRFAHSRSQRTMQSRLQSRLESLATAANQLARDKNANSKIKTQSRLKNTHYKTDCTRPKEIV